MVRLRHQTSASMRKNDWNHLHLKQALRRHLHTLSLVRVPSYVLFLHKCVNYFFCCFLLVLYNICLYYIKINWIENEFEKSMSKARKFHFSLCVLLTDKCFHRIWNNFFFFLIFYRKLFKNHLFAYFWKVLFIVF